MSRANGSYHPALAATAPQPATRPAAAPACIEHPHEVPLLYRTVTSAVRPYPRSAGIGVRFAGRHPVERGRTLAIRIFLGDEVHRFHGTVADIEKDGVGYAIRLWVSGERQAFTARMAEQLCHIEHYRRLATRRRGREVSADQAAREWVERYAATFPAL